MQDVPKFDEQDPNVENGMMIPNQEENEKMQNTQGNDEAQNEGNYVASKEEKDSYGVPSRLEESLKELQEFREKQSQLRAQALQASEESR